MTDPFRDAVRRAYHPDMPSIVQPWADPAGDPVADIQAAMEAARDTPWLDSAGRAIESSIRDVMLATVRSRELAIIHGLGIRIPIDEDPAARLYEQHVDPDRAVYVISPLIERMEMYAIPSVPRVPGAVLVIPVGSTGHGVLTALKARGHDLQPLDQTITRTSEKASMTEPTPDDAIVPPVTADQAAEIAEEWGLDPATEAYIRGDAPLPDADGA